MRIALLSWRDSTHPDGGGSEVFVEQVARRLVARGHRVTLLCAAHGEAPRISDLDGVTVFRTGGRLTVYPRGLWWLLRHRHRIDVVVDVVNGIPFGAALVKPRASVALVHHSHREQWQIIYPGLWGRVGWFIEHRVAGRLYRGRPHLTVSDASARDLRARGVPDGDITVVHNGVELHRSTASRSATPRVCVLARLVPHKRIEHAFAAVAALTERFPGLHLDVIGDGWWRENLVADLASRGLTERVTMHGHVSEAERDDLLAGAWLMLLPSVKEGWGLAVMEAAAQGTPTLAYRYAGGVAESVVEGRTGWLAEDEDSFRRLLGELLADPARIAAAGERARARAASFDWDQTTGSVERVLTEVAGED